MTRALAIPLGIVVLATAAAATAPLPPADEVGQVDFDLLDYFTRSELDSWSGLATQHRLASLLRLPVSIGFYLALLFTPLGRRLKALAHRLAVRLGLAPSVPGEPARRRLALASRVFGDDWASALLFTYGYLFLSLLCLLPFSLWREWLDQQAGLSNHTVGTWIWDLVKAQFLVTLIFTLLVFGLFGLIRRTPRSWWLLLGLPTALMLFGYGVVSPYRARVFHEFTPLTDTLLQDRLQALANAEGLTLSEMRVVDASRTTNAANAYVTGVGPTRELVLFDNLLEELTHDEIAIVVAHELGHHRRRDIVTRYALSGVSMIVLLFFLAKVLAWASVKLGHDGPGDVLNLPLIFLCVALLFLTLRPANKAYSRYEERLADRAAYELTRDATAFVDVWVKLARINQADVDPPVWSVWWFSSHPTIRERIATGLWYRRWEASQAEPGGRSPPE